MSNGFFSLAPTTTVGVVPPSPLCGLCRLDRGCKSPKIPVWGQGRKKILVVGEAPGQTEDERGIPFCGQSGQFLKNHLRPLGIDLGTDCWVTNALICRPPGNKIEDKNAVSYCRPNVVNAVTELSPERIVLLGNKAVESVMAWVAPGVDLDPHAKWANHPVPSRRLNAWVASCWHPSFVMRTDYGVSERENEVRTMIWGRQLMTAFVHGGRPWEDNTDPYKGRCGYAVDYNDALDGLSEMLACRKGRPIAFDYECDRLKPDHPDSRIICVSVSDGRHAFAFPWNSHRVKRAWREFLLSDVPKIGFNVKYEERWSRAVVGCGVNNWVWCGMTAAHCLDSFKGVKSLDFQALILLGVSKESHDLKPYMVSDGPNEPNRLAEAPLERLLEYCSRDSMLEWHVARLQRKLLTGGSRG